MSVPLSRSNLYLRERLGFLLANISGHKGVNPKYFEVNNFFFSFTFISQFPSSGVFLSAGQPFLCGRKALLSVLVPTPPRAGCLFVSLRWRSPHVGKVPQERLSAQAAKPSRLAPTAALARLKKAFLRPGHHRLVPGGRHQPGRTVAHIDPHGHERR